MDLQTSMTNSPRFSKGGSERFGLEPKVEQQKENNKQVDTFLEGLDDQFSLDLVVEKRASVQQSIMQESK